jgi:hypothetical protein
MTEKPTQTSYATKTLPPDFEPLYTLDLTKDLRVGMYLNLAVLFMLFIFGYLFLWAGRTLRPEAWSGEQTLLGEIGLVDLAVVFVLMVLLHEGIHGLFFWVYTGERPKFGLKLLYAYASAPDWYIRRNPFMWVGLSPLILISLSGVLLIPWIPVGWIPALILFLTINAAGSMGDAFIILKLLSQPDDALIQDLGDSFTIYGHKL